MIASILLIIAVGIVLQVVVRGFAGSGSSRAGGISDAALVRTTDSLGDDIARAGTNDNIGGAIRDKIGFADAIRRHQVAYKPAVRGDGSIDTNAPMQVADVDDVKVANSNMLQLVSRDSCVTWRAVPGSVDGVATIDITRSVAPATNCNAITSTRRMLSVRSTAPGFTTSPFSYSLVCNPAVCAGSGAARSAPCRPWVVRGNVPANRLRWVVGVDATIVTMNSSGHETAAARSGLSRSIRSREVGSYREALGC